jgi:hypothetical protein
MSDANITIGAFVTGFRDAFSDAATAVACNTTIEAAIPLPACVAAQTNGELTTRTNNTEGVITLATGHGIVNGTVDIYWAAGRRFGVVVTRDGNLITLTDSGAGDNLPILNTTGITVVTQVAGNINFDGDDMKVVAIVYRNISDTTAKAHIDFQDADDASIEDLDLLHETASGGLVRTVNVFNISGGDTNVFTGNRVTHQGASHNSLYAATIFVKLGYDA